MPKYNSIEYPVDQIRQWIEQGWTQARIAEKLAVELDPRVTAKLVYKVCRKNGIQCQRTGPRSGEGHPEWNGGRIVNKDGYIEVYHPGHPNARKWTRYILEHRLVMESVLGRYLLKTEVVHHKNGNKQDNRPENLEVFSTNSEHLSATLKGCVPVWTEAGKSRIGTKGAKLNLSEEQRERHRLRGKTLHAIREALGLRACPNKQTIDRYLGELGKDFAWACGMVARREPLPRFAHPTP